VRLSILYALVSTQLDAISNFDWKVTCSPERHPLTHDVGRLSAAVAGLGWGSGAIRSYRMLIRRGEPIHV